MFNGTGEIKVRYEYLDGGIVKEESKDFLYEDAEKFFDKFTQYRLQLKTIEKPKEHVDIIYPSKSNIHGMKEVRQILFDSLNGVKDGNITSEQSKCISMLAQTFINTIKVEIEHNRNKINGEIDLFNK